MGASARFDVSLTWFALAFGIVVAGGCSNQGEGERCDLLNGSADCAAGLVCTSFATSADAGTSDIVPLCCPSNRQTSSFPQCRQTISAAQSGGAVPAATAEIDAGEPVDVEDADLSAEANADPSQGSGP